METSSSGDRNSTLYLANIPTDKNTSVNLCSHFSKFGKVLSADVAYNDDPSSAAVTFQSHNDAKAAFTSPMVLLNNRSIKMTLVPSNVKSESDTNLNCVLCNTTYSSKPSLTAHVKLVHGAPIFTCNVCKAPFSSKIMYNKHIQNQHSIASVEDNDTTSKDLDSDHMATQSKEHGEQNTLLQAQVDSLKNELESSDSKLTAVKKVVKQIKRGIKTNH